jgi:hypothetical protein
MQTSFGFKACSVRFFFRGICAKACRFSPDPDHGAPSWSVFADTLVTGCVISLDRAIDQILALCGKAKIAPSVVQSVSIYVVDTDRRPFSSHQQPDHTMGTVNPLLPVSLDGQDKPTVITTPGSSDRTSYSAYILSAATGFLPRLMVQKAGCWIVAISGDEELKISHTAQYPKPTTGATI